MLKLLKYMCVMMLLLSASAHSADITCSTSFPDLVPESGDISQIHPADLDDWVTALKDDDCARPTISQYGALESVVTEYKPGTRLKELEIINKSAALLDALNVILAQEEFYGDMESKLQQLLPESITIDTVKDLVFDITSVDIDGNAVFTLGKSDNAQVDQLLTYLKSCAVLDSSSCKEWERYVRFFAAMTYAVEDISESYSKILIATLETELTEYISDWDDYYKNRKPQLPWELLSNEAWNREIRESEYFPRPPQSDLVILHPQLVYTNFESFDSEAQIEATILWEIVGINYWDNRVVTGISVVSPRLDNTDSLGLLLTLRNTYSFGVYDQEDDGETWFVSVDLFDFIVDKENEYKEILETNLEGLK